MSNFDSVWKEAIELFFEPFMAMFLAKAHSDIDWNRGFTMLDKELQQITPDSARGRRVVDMLVQVWRGNGHEEWVLIHIEVQSQQEADFAERMFVYYYRAYDRYNQKVASIAILGDSRPAWRPDHFDCELWGTQLGFQFVTVKLLDYARNMEELESNPNPFAVVVLAHLEAIRAAHYAEARRRSEVRLVKRLFERGFDAEKIRQLYRLIDAMMELPIPLAKLAWKEIYDISREKGMQFVTGAELVGHEKGSRQANLEKEVEM